MLAVHKIQLIFNFPLWLLSTTTMLLPTASGWLSVLVPSLHGAFWMKIIESRMTALLPLPYLASPLQT